MRKICGSLKLSATCSLMRAAEARSVPSGFSSTTRELGVTTCAAARFAAVATYRLGEVDRNHTRSCASRSAMRALSGPEVLDARRVHLLIVQAGGEFAPALLAEFRGPPDVRGCAPARGRCTRRAIMRAARGGENARAGVKLAGHEALIQRRQELAHGQIAGAPEQDDFKRIEQLQVPPRLRPAQ